MPGSYWPNIIGSPSDSVIACLANKLKCEETGDPC